MAFDDTWDDYHDDDDDIELDYADLRDHVDELDIEGEVAHLVSEKLRHLPEFEHIEVYYKGEGPGEDSDIKYVEVSVETSVDAPNSVDAIVCISSPCMDLYPLLYETVKKIDVKNLGLSQKSFNGEIESSGELHWDYRREKEYETGGYHRKTDVTFYDVKIDDDDCDTDDFGWCRVVFNIEGELEIY